MKNFFHYNALVELSNTTKITSGWNVIVSDIAGSTRAVKEGRYKEVNYVGAACITAITNQFSEKEVPYVFGGDGATFLVEDKNLEKCLTLLSTVKNLAQSQFLFHLRVGFVSVKEITEQGGELYLGFVKWSEFQWQPFFRGNGLLIAEKIIKSKIMEEDKFEKNLSQHETLETLNGLTCRLSPFPSQQGGAVSLIVEPRVPISEEDEIFKSVIFAAQGEREFLALNPTQKKNKNLKRLSKNSFVTEFKSKSYEKKFLQKCKLFFSLLKEFLLTHAVFKYNINNNITGNPKEYEAKMFLQSDWLKADGVLRMVVDLAEKDYHRLKLKLDELYSQKKIFFGLHVSKGALMTCYIKSSENHQHTHFIDGQDGGFVLAALMLKEQKKTSTH
jgi:Protein of unknown function (DUF3095)